MGERYEQRGRRTGRTTAVFLAALIAVAIASSPRPASAVGALTDVGAQKAAAKCQKLIAKTTAKALAGKLKTFNACAAAALGCVQSKRDVVGCDVKANAVCTKKLAGAAAAAAKAKAKIIADKSCRSLPTPDLLASDGLGFGAIAGPCAADYGIDVCQGLEPIADCVLTSHDASAGGLLGRAVPRTPEILGLLAGAPFADATGVPPYAGGCGTCGAPTESQKPVEKCGKALSAGTQAAAAVLEGAYGACTLDLYDCAELGGDDAACVAKATAGCTKASARAAKVFAKLEAVATKACGTSFAAASAASGLGLGSLSARCADLGVATLDGPAALAACLGAEARCAIATLVRNTVPRTAEFVTAATVGGLADALAATCPTASALQTAALTTGARAATAPRGLFGSILKLVKNVKRTVPNAVGVRAPGGKPKTTGGGSGVSKVTGPTKAKFGGISKFNVSYHKSRGRIGGGGNGEAAPPVLIVAITRADSVLDDHFEIPLLTTPGDGSDVEDEIEVEFGDALPSCAFELGFTTVADGEVGEYASILQVVDEKTTTATGPAIVSRGPADVQQDGAADGTNVAVSADGRYVAFTSLATNLVAPADQNGRSDVFIRDRCVSDGVPIEGCTPTTTLESVGPGGEPFNPAPFGHVAISDDGRFLAFDATIDRDPNPPIVATYRKDRCFARGEVIDPCILEIRDVTFDGETLSNGGVLNGLSSDGRYVVFASATIGNEPTTVSYAYDSCQSSTFTVDGGCEATLGRISDNAGGGVSNGDADWAAVSRTGRFVALRTDASDMIAPGLDTNGASDVYVFDRCLDSAGNAVPQCVGSTERVNLGPNLAQSAGDDAGSSLTNLAISDDGRYVAFASDADDLLAPGLDTNGERDVFVRDLCIGDGTPVANCTQTTERVNVGPGGTESNGTLPSGWVLGMSANGRLIVFASDATNLLGPAVGTPDGTYQVFLRDRCLDKGVAIPDCTPATTLVSAAADGGRGVGLSRFPAIAAGGATTGFISSAANLLGPGVDANHQPDVFVRDR